MKADDWELAEKIQKQMVIPAETLLSLRRLHGAEGLRTSGYDLSHANHVYGDDWLDRPIEEITAINRRR